jgi:hypothetical protein
MGGGGDELVEHERQLHGPQDGQARQPVCREVINNTYESWS